MAELKIKVNEQIVTRLLAHAGRHQESPEQAVAFILDRWFHDIPKRSIIPVADYKPQRIPVMLDTRTDRIKKQFRCTVCGTIVFYYYGSVMLIANGQYDQRTNMIDGEEVDWFSKTGVPDEIICPGRMFVRDQDNRDMRVDCGTRYYKSGV